MLESEKYKLSTYERIEVLHCGAETLVELVQCTLDGQKYIKKICHADKRDIYRRLQQIECNYIPKIYEIFFGEDTIIIEEYIEGKTLEKLANEKESFSKKDIRKILDGLLGAVDTLHKNSLIHRDIKPSNVIVKENGEAVLIDYSIARVYDSGKVEDTELMGTKGYAAPEQYGFSQSDYRTDIYGLGATINLIVTKKNATRSIRKIIKKCMEFDPTHRFPTINKVRKAIRAIRVKKLIIACGALILAFTLGICFFPYGYNDEVVYYDTVYGLTWRNGELKAPSLLMTEDGVYKTKISLDGGKKETRIEAVKEGRKIEVTIDGKQTFDFEDMTEEYCKYYPTSGYYAELLFYDTDKDGYKEIIPIMANAFEDIQGSHIMLLENYTVAWAIYYDGNSFHKATGEAFVEESEFIIGRSEGWLTCLTMPDGRYGNFYVKDGEFIFSGDYEENYP